MLFRSEIEKLRAELKLEKAKRQKAEMEVSFLKKLEEIERSFLYNSNIRNSEKEG